MKGVLKRIATRLLTGLGVLWGAATLTFLAINLTGGDPALAILGGTEAVPTPAVLERVRADYHLDKPLAQQYVIFLAKLAQGDLGESYRLRISVSKAIGQQLGATVEVGLVAGTLALVFSVAIALLTARTRPWLRGLASGAELMVSSTPGFVLGIGLLLVFAFQLHWLPASGQSGWKSLVLPSLTLALPLIAVYSQVLRNQLEDILEQPFILTARARGLSEAGVRLRHALRHTLIPLITLSGSFFGMLLGGTVITETLFARQGIGRLIADATSNKDVPIVIGVTVLTAAVYVTVNLVVDLLNAWVDPRTRQA